MKLSESQIDILLDISLKSGEIAMKYFNKNSDLSIKRKDDNSPVTQADTQISNLIKQCLDENFSDISIICEEGNNRTVIGEKFWLIDPIDGTKSFINKEPEFTINIALIENNKPIFGLIFAPAIKDAPLYYTNENNQVVKYLTSKGQKDIVANNSKIANKLNIITSKTTKDSEIHDHIQANLADTDAKEMIIDRLASSLKFCKIIECESDLYLHFKRSMEWDTAAGHALILGCGGKVLNLNGSDLLYQKKGFVNKHFVVQLSSE